MASTQKPLLTRLENAIAKVADDVSNRVRVGINPDESDETNVKQFCNVRFIEKTLEDPSNRGRLRSLRQEVTYKFQIEIIFNNTRTHQDTYSFIEKLTDAYSGSEIVQNVDHTLSRVWLGKVAFKERADDVCWIYTIDISFSGVETKC